METINVQKYDNLDINSFNNLVQKDKPFVMKNIDFGECLNKWSIIYLTEKLKDIYVSVHVSNDPKLDFINKNFSYKKMTFNEFMDKCVNDNQNYYYLRSVGVDRRARDVANIKTHFPSIADDIKIPSFLSICENKSECNECNECNECSHNQLFSSVFRISSKDLIVWTHYDILDNVLVQIKGRKRVILFPPDNSSFLYLKDDKSKIIDLDQPMDQMLEKYPLFANTVRYECILEENESLFIPSLWFHSTKALEFSIGMNFFWRDKQISDENLYNKSDVYGNKDLNPAIDAFINIDKAIKHIDKMPPKFRDFYLRIIINKLQNKLN